MSKTEVSAPLLVSAATAAEMLDMSRANVYKLIERGHLRRVKIGRSSRIRVADLERLAAEGAE